MPEPESKKPSCFIAMPISTPEHLVSDYGGDTEHFRHVLDCLFIPAVEAAGMIPISPISKGSEVIHADIIEHLQTADLVLVDMSSLNANAFFEYGIRTSLNKPVCVVRDDRTPNIPFDAALVNAEMYNSKLDAWSVKAEMPKICEHIRAALARSGGQNALWKHFGFRIAAEPTTPPKDDSEKLDLILSQLSVLMGESEKESYNVGNKLVGKLLELGILSGMPVDKVELDDKTVSVYPSRPINKATEERFLQFAGKAFPKDLTVRVVPFVNVYEESRVGRAH
jgi:hypothetical protein